MGGRGCYLIIHFKDKKVEKFSKFNFEIFLCFLPSPAQQAWPLAWLQIRAQQLLINQDQTETIEIRNQFDFWPYLAF